MNTKDLIGKRIKYYFWNGHAETYQVASGLVEDIIPANTIPTNREYITEGSIADRPMKYDRICYIDDKTKHHMSVGYRPKLAKELEIIED